MFRLQGKGWRWLRFGCAEEREKPVVKIQPKDSIRFMPPYLLLAVAVALLALGIVIVALNLPLRWRGTLLAATLALWFWSMSFALVDFIAFAEGFGRAMGDPSRLAGLMGNCLIKTMCMNLACGFLLMLSALAFLLHRPRSQPH